MKNISLLSKFYFVILSLINGFLFTFLIIVIDFLLLNNEYEVLQFLNLLVIVIPISNLSTGQILQKYLINKNVFLNLISLLSFLIILGLGLVFLLNDEFKYIGFALAVSSIINLVDLFNIANLFCGAPLKGIIISLICRIIVTGSLYLSLITTISLFSGLIMMILLLILMIIFLIYFNRNFILIDRTDKELFRNKLFDDFIKFNLTNWPVSFANNIIRIFFYDLFSFDLKISFEYLSKVISLVLMFFDYQFRFQIRKVTNVAINRGFQFPIKYYLKKFSIYFIFIFSLVLIYGIYLNSFFIVLCGLFLIFFNFFLFINYLSLIRGNVRNIIIVSCLIFSLGYFGLYFQRPFLFLLLSFFILLSFIFFILNHSIFPKKNDING
jgi:hypothetical protein